MPFIPPYISVIRLCLSVLHMFAVLSVPPDLLFTSSRSLTRARSLSGEKQSRGVTKPVNESNSRLTETLISFFPSCMCALSGVSRGQGPHSATLYLLTSRHLIIKSAHRLGGHSHQ